MTTALMLLFFFMVFYPHWHEKKKKKTVSGAKSHENDSVPVFVIKKIIIELVLNKNQLRILPNIVKRQYDQELRPQMNRYVKYT